MSNYDRLSDPDFNQNIIETVCIPTVVMFQRLNGGAGSDYETAYDYRKILAESMYNGIRNKWPQVNERTRVIEYPYQEFRIPTDHAPRPLNLHPEELLPGVGPALIRALRGSRLMARLCRSRFKWIKNRANRWALVLMGKGYTIRASIATNVEVYYMERVDTAIEGYFGNGVTRLLLPFRGLYIPRTDTLYYRRIWAVTDVPVYPPAHGGDPSWYPAPIHPISPDVVDKAYLDSLDAIVKRYGLKNEPTKLNELPPHEVSPDEDSDNE